MKKIIPIAIILLIVYLLYKWWASQENGSATINCDKCVNDVPTTFQHTGSSCPSGSILSGQGNPCPAAPVLPVNANINVALPEITGETNVSSNPMMRGILTGGADIVLREPVVVDPANPNISSNVLYDNKNVLHPVLPITTGTVSIGTCPNPLNNNSNYISILTSSPMTTTGVMQFLNLMRIGYNNGENNPNSSGCRFLKLRRTHHIAELAATPQSSLYITNPHHRVHKQAKVDFLTATINNCCVCVYPNTSPNSSPVLNKYN